MSDSSAAITRYPIGFRHATKRFPPMAIVAAVVTAAALAWCVSRGTHPLLIVAPIAIGFLVPAGSLRLHAIEHRVIAYIAATLLLCFVAYWTDGIWFDFVALYAAALWLGHVVTTWASRRKESRRRLAAAEGAPPSGLDPGRHRRLPLLATWFDEHADCELTNPPLEPVLEAVRRLDGHRCSLVSVFRGRARLDVGGDVRTGLIVQQADNRHRWQRTGRQLTTGDTATDDAHPTAVRFARDWVAVPSSCLVPVADAEAAVTTWIDAGHRDSSLTWARARESGVTRPKLLTAQDQPWTTWWDGFATGTLGSPVQLPYGSGGNPT